MRVAIPSGKSAAIACTLAAVACFSALDTTTKVLASAVPVVMVVWFRYLFQVLLTVMTTAPSQRRQLHRSRRPGLQVLRGAMLVTATVVGAGGSSGPAEAEVGGAAEVSGGGSAVGSDVGGVMGGAVTDADGVLEPPMATGPVGTSGPRRTTRMVITAASIATMKATAEKPRLTAWSRAALASSGGAMVETSIAAASGACESLTARTSAPRTPAAMAMVNAARRPGARSGNSNT